MSLFADSRYRWRETYFVLFKAANLPSFEAIGEMLRELGPEYESAPVCADGEGNFESVMIRAPQDFAAMDVTCVVGEDVSEQVDELEHELTKAALGDEAESRLEKLRECDARFEVYHFEQLPEAGEDVDDDDGFLDPGSLINILRQLAVLSKGIGIDPQTGLLN